MSFERNLRVISQQDMKIQKYYNDIFEQINGVCSDYDVLEIGTEMIKIARDRLDKDLDNKEIYTEYVFLNKIVNQLNEIMRIYK